MNDNLTNEALGLVERAEEQFSQKEYAEAYKLYKEALDLLQRKSSFNREKRLWVRTYKGIVNSLSENGDYVGSQQFIGTLTSLAVNNKDKRLELECRLMAANSLQNRGNWKEAEKKYNALLILAKAAKIDHILIETYYGLSAMKWRQGDLMGASAMCNKALEFFSAEDLTEQYCNGLYRKATIASTGGETEKAKKYFQETIEKLETLEPTLLLSRSYNNLGELYKGLGEYETAAEKYQRCVDVAKEIGNDRIRIYGSGNLAECFAFTGRTKEARALMNDIAGIIESSQDRYITALMKYTWGLIELQDKEYSKAINLFNATIAELEKQATSVFDLGVAYYQLAFAHKGLGNKEKVDDAFANAKKCFIETDAKIQLKELKKHYSD